MNIHKEIHCIYQNPTQLTSKLWQLAKCTKPFCYTQVGMSVGVSKKDLADIKGKDMFVGN